MLGGRIRGQGTFGCIFQPALECRSKKSKSTNADSVGKIAAKVDAKNELYIASILHKIPGFSNYTIPVEQESCVPKAKKHQVEPDIEKCDLMETFQLEDVVQMTMPWGGYSLSRINLDPYVFDYFKFMEESLACATFLLLNDICHFDLGGNNILFDASYKPKIIDFGFSFKASKFTIKDLSNRWRVNDFTHDVETPEVTLMLCIHKNMTIEHIIQQLEKKKPAVQLLTTLCDVNPVHWSGELYQWTKDSQSFQAHDWLNCWKMYWPGFDAWSIGALFLMILEIQITMPGFKYANNTLIKNVIKGLCRSHPAFRLDAAEALSLLTDGKHPLISSGSAGSAWISEKRKNRPPV